MTQGAPPNQPPPKTAVDLLLLDAPEGLRIKLEFTRRRKHDCCGNAWPPLPRVLPADWCTLCSLLLM